MPANFSIVAPSAGPEVSADAVARRLCDERRPADPNSVSNRLQALEEHRRLFGLLSLRIMAIVSDARLKLPELASLHRLAVEALQLSKLLFRELDGDASSNSGEVPAATIADLLACNARQLERIERQLWLVESIDTCATGLKECIHELQQSHSLPPGRFQQVARRVCIDVDRSCVRGFLRTESGLSIQSLLARRNDLGEPAIYATGIESARLVAWLSGLRGNSAARREFLTIGALLQDVGLFGLCRANKVSVERLAEVKSNVYREHPAFSAAIAASISQYAVELPYLISQHHERLDGTGYPRKLTGRRISRESRLLAVVSRYLELAGGTRLNVLKSETPVSSGPSSEHIAGRQLYREAEQGEFDLALSVDLLKGLGFEFRDEGAFSPTHLRLDSAHATTGGPHFRELRSEQFPGPHFQRRRSLQQSHPIDGREP